MTWYTIVPAILILLCLVIFITKISIKAIILYTPLERQVVLRVRVWFIPFTIDVLKLLQKRKEKQNKEPKQEETSEDSVSEWLERMPNLIKSAGDIHTILKGFLQKIKVKKFSWSSHIGTGDAAATGILAGQVWSVKGIAIGLISHYMRVVGQPQLEVHPVFQGTAAATRLECAVSFRSGPVIFTAIKLLRYIKKHRSVLIGQTEQLHQ
ncbi:DUF2953 domain-containing protein [Ectobacillus funiculus]|uniref:DUF2953 domain-containing protein n=1 Tax=Ectobacillus funiculus TaxID=137993 RepID=UPI003977E697